VGATFLAAAFGGAVFFAAAFLATGFLAGLLAAVFFAKALTFFAGGRLEAAFFADFFTVFFAAIAFFVFFFSVLALLAFFTFLAMIVLPIVAADFPTHRAAIKHDSLRPYGSYSLRLPLASDHPIRSSAFGADPPVAQSINSIG